MIDVWGVYRGESGVIQVDSQSATQADGTFSRLLHSHNNASLSITSNDGDALTLDLDNESDTCYTYDNDGNLVYKSSNGASMSYDWDALDRLSCVYFMDNESVVRHEKYLYNGDGHRIYTIADGSLTQATA